MTILYGTDPKFVDLINHQANTFHFSELTDVDYFAIVGSDVPQSLLERLEIPYRVEVILPCASWCQDTLKIHAWKYLEYDRILILDADCYFRRPVSLKDTPEFGCLGGEKAPINAARLVIKPDLDIYHQLLEAYPTVNYDFNCGNGFQGAIFHVLAHKAERLPRIGDHVIQHGMKKLPRTKLL